MKKQAYTVAELVLALVGLSLLAVAVFPMLHARRQATEKPTICQSRLKLAALGFKQYQQDYDLKYPIINSGKAGWMDIIQPYLKSYQFFQCPEDSSGVVSGTTDYFYNAHFSGISEGALNFPTTTIMSGDGIGNSPRNVSLLQLPRDWITDKKSPANRHLEGANYSLSDGSVRWFNPASISNEKSNGTNISFVP